MKCNVGGMDRTARLVVGVILVLAGLLAPVAMPWRILLFIIAAIALVTATVRYCPANAVLGINTFEGKDGK
jgi:disulfide bond formation protein DsbB